jgi:predicted nuclease with RNAse H fold
MTCQQVVDLVMTDRPAVVAIDSPRSFAPGGKTARESELQLARPICGIRWTPDARPVHASIYYAWILEGHALFGALAARGADVIEVFPTASWTRWHGKRDTRTRAAWMACHRGPAKTSETPSPLPCRLASTRWP